MIWDVNFSGKFSSSLAISQCESRGKAGGSRRGRMVARAMVLAALVAGGCQTVEVEDRPRPLIKTNGKVVPTKGDGPLTPDVIAATDPCATRLEDIEGLILEYYVIHGHQMPPRLEDVRSLAQVDTVVDFNCPASGQPYVYVYPGLPDLTSTHRLVLYDAVPDKTGQRWCVIMDEPKGRDLIMHARQLTDSQFRVYAPK